jgi:hypothetical protein
MSGAEAIVSFLDLTMFFADLWLKGPAVRTEIIKK